ncbi:MAG: hypothetical protein ACI32E_00195 [Bacilli bacterium]
MVKKVFSIIEKVFIGILVCAILILAIYLVKRAINKNEPTKMFGYYMFSVSSDSMYNENDKDSLTRGDLIFVKPLKDDEYEVGMVVTYLSDSSSMPVTHKIVKREGSIITTRGISVNNTSDDDPFDVSQILGEVKGVWRGYEKFLNWTKSPFGIICIVGFLFLIFEGFNLIQKSPDKSSSTSTDVSTPNENINDGEKVNS